jgi:hypothetical protein
MKSIIQVAIAITLLSACQKGGSNGGAGANQQGPQGFQHAGAPNSSTPTNPNAPGTNTPANNNLIGQWQPVGFTTANGASFAISNESHDFPDFYEFSDTQMTSVYTLKNGNTFTEQVDYTLQSNANAQWIRVRKPNHEVWPNYQIFKLTNDEIQWKAICRTCANTIVTLKKMGAPTEAKSAAQ